MERLREFIARTHNEKRQTARARKNDETDSIGVTNANDLHTVSAFFLAGTARDERQARMDAFQRRLADFHDRDMIVVAIAVGSHNE